MTFRFWIPLITLGLLACAGGRGGGKAPLGSPGIKMRHQILFSNGRDDHVFEGYMLQTDGALLVKAFAGPGVDLFTVVHRGPQHREFLHIKSLKDRIDIAKVSADIARIYMGGCGDSLPGDRQCDFLGETMIETFDETGRLISRRFPEAHGIGVSVDYTEYFDHRGRLFPRRIVLKWGSTANQMVIRLVEVEEMPSIADGVFDQILATP